MQKEREARLHSLFKLVQTSVIPALKEQTWNFSCHTWALMLPLNIIDCHDFFHGLYHWLVLKQR
jgi:hypothetical protein